MRVQSSRIDYTERNCSSSKPTFSVTLAAVSHDRKEVNLTGNK